MSVLIFCRYFSFTLFFSSSVTHLYLHSSLHDALPICQGGLPHPQGQGRPRRRARPCPHQGRARGRRREGDRKSTRLNSSHLVISYAVFCLKKKKMQQVI